MTASRSQPDERRHRRPWQFGLRSVFALTAGVALLSSIFFALPQTPACLILLCLSFPQAPLLAVMIFCGKGYLRAFCIGAMFPAQVLFLFNTYMVSAVFWSGGWEDLSVWVEMAEEGGEPYLIWVAATWGVSVVFGFLSVAVLWLMKPGSRKDEAKPAEASTPTEMQNAPSPHFAVAQPADSRRLSRF